MPEEMVPLKDIFAILGQKEFELQLLRAKLEQAEDLVRKLREELLKRPVFENKLNG